MKDADGKILVTIQGQLIDPATGDVAYVLVTDGQYMYYMADDTAPWVYNIDLGKWQTHSDGRNRVKSVEITLDATADLTDTLQEIIDSLNGQLGDANDLIADLLNDVASLNDLDVSGSFDDAITSVKSSILNYVEKLNKSLERVLNSANSVLQPVLLVAHDGKIGRVSRAKAYPTAGNGTVTLIPTSYNLDLLAPAYKKFVAVANVFDTATGAQADNAASLAATANGGENMKTVIDGDKTVKLQGESGYTYEVIYSAVDFHGVVTNRRYYVKF